MGLFSNLMARIFGGASRPVPAAATTPTAHPSTGVPLTPVTTTVDVGAVLDALAAKSPEDLDWKRSIVDLMKLVGMDSSLACRKELARELNYTGDQADSATMNTWLHKQVLKKLAENGGKIPANLLD